MATTTAALPRRSRGSRFQRGLQPYLYLVPAFLVMAIITFYPLLFQVWMSFHDFGQINFRVRNPVPAEFIGLDNYVRIATSKLQIPNFEFLRLVLFNLWWAFSNVVVHIIIGVAVAVVLNTKGLRFRGVYRALFILPVLIPQIIVATVWRNMFDQDADLGSQRPSCRSRTSSSSGWSCSTCGGRSAMSACTSSSGWPSPSS